MTNKLVCSYCGTTFDASETSACNACPLGKNCQLTCCPKCGFENINTDKSTVGKLLGKLFNKRNSDTIKENSERITHV